MPDPGLPGGRDVTSAEVPETRPILLGDLPQPDRDRED
jgi:hypothetical protein